MEKMNRQRIAFIRIKSHSIPYGKVEAILREKFPELVIDTLNISEILRSNPFVILINLLLVAILYGWDILSGRKEFSSAFWHTPYIFRFIRRAVRTLLKKNDYQMTFQMQSLFDASIPGTPHFIYTDHTHLENLNYPGFDPKNLYPKQWINLEKEIYKNATRIFTWSSNVKRSLESQYECDPKKVECVFVGANIEPSNSKAESSNDHHPEILFVGIDWERKGGPALINAFKKLLISYPNAHLTIVGSNPNLNIPNCTVVGKLPLEKISPYYAHADLFCLPTNLEPFGIVFLEAMSAKLPIVATRIGAIPDFIQNGWNGWLIEPGDVDGLINAITRIVNNEREASLFGERSYNLVKGRYNWSSVAERIHSSILEALNDLGEAGQNAASIHS